jgi:hypothetical protein
MQVAAGLWIHVASEASLQVVVGRLDPGCFSDEVPSDFKSDIPPG